ncbi:TPA: hypothetical protein NIB55_004182 [Pseudomonas aeruginosa]|nr:hypothetical protein [Pseudomonas aeruginosa]
MNLLKPAPGKDFTDSIDEMRIAGFSMDSREPGRIADQMASAVLTCSF